MSDPSRSITVSQICDAVGRKTLQSRLRINRQAVSNACVEGRFPAKWFAVVRDECALQGLPCPDHLFAFTPSDLE